MMRRPPRSVCDRVEQRPGSNHGTGDVEVEPVPEMTHAAHKAHLRHADQKKSDSVESDSFRTDSQCCSCHPEARLACLERSVVSREPPSPVFSCSRQRTEY